MAVKTLKSEKFNWYYLNDFTDEELGFLKTNFKFHPLDLKDCAGEKQRSKIDIYKNYIFIVLQLPTLSDKKVSVRQVYFFVGKDFLITIGKGKIKVLNDLFYKTVHNTKFQEDVFSNGSGYLLYKVLDTLFRNGWGIHSGLDAAIHSVEQEIYDGRGKKSVFDIADLRRVILQLRALIDPQKIVTNTLSRIDAPYLGKDMAVYFDDLDDFIEKNWFSIDGHKERVLNLQEINESLISYRTNQVIKVLTIFSVALLPMTLLSGIYGMNIELPFMSEPVFVAGLFALIALTTAGLLYYFKKKDFI